MNARIVTLLGILLSTAAFAQLEVSTTNVERVEPGHGPEGAKQITLHVQNNSNKDVAAFDVQLTLKLTDGSTIKQDCIEDFGYRATHDGNKKQGIPKLLAAGEGIDVTHIINADESLMSVRLAAVIYADRTAHGDSEAIDGIVSSRKHFADRLLKDDPPHATKAASYAQDDLRRQP